ncbi:MAG TPA: amidohydrolase [Candidatus Thermoplasmatota archaeon]|nr:amidohydrolase [Candidatus Thermoplasmatota archaeon]
MPSLLVRDAVVLTLDAQRRVLRGDVRVEDGVVTHVGDAPQHADDVVDAGGDILLPGFVNAHTHAAMTLLRGLGDDLALEEWLRTRIWPAEKTLTRAEVEAGTDLALLEMLRTGTVAFNDMYFFAEATAERVVAAGMRARIGATLIDFDTPELKQAEQAAHARRLLRKHAAHPLVSFSVAPHSVYSCSDATLAEVRAIRDELGAPVHTHCSETRFEVQDTLAKRGARPVEVLRKHDLLRGAVLAHCGWVTKDEVRALAAEGAHAAHCPVSNMKLATGGTMPLLEMWDAGVNVAMGTDGAASNNTLDVLGETKFAALVQKQHRWDARAAPAQRVLEAATLGGRRALGLSAGGIAPGEPADLALVSTAGPHMRPRHDPASTLVYCASGADVRATIVAGRVLYLDGAFRTIDAPRALRSAEEAGARLARTVADGLRPARSL